jgi:DNA-binding transcriptional LysR family regulator
MTPIRFMTMKNMASGSLSRVDLNLLVTLDALLTEESVSRAAQRLALTQSAVSRALARLRDTFGDELFVRTGHGMRATRRALELAAPLRRTLAELEGLLNAEAAFLPATSRRRFRICGVDYATSTLVAPLSCRLEREAPGVDLVLRPLAAESDRDLETGDLDLLLEPKRAAGAGIVWTPLYEDTYSAIVSRDHPSPRFTLREFASAPHALVSPWGRPGGIVDQMLAEHGLSRRVAVQVPTFSALPEVLVGTRRLATVPTRMARRLCDAHPLKLATLPLRVPAFTMFMAWHELHRHDPGHAWLRDRLTQFAAEATLRRRRDMSK